MSSPYTLHWPIATLTGVTARDLVSVAELVSK
jgi:hypothetical protein